MSKTVNFSSIHQVYMPSFGEPNDWGSARWQPHELTAIDEDGNLWGLYWDSKADVKPGEQKTYRWLKYEAKVGLP